MSNTGKGIAISLGRKAGMKGAVKSQEEFIEFVSDESGALEFSTAIV